MYVQKINGIVPFTTREINITLNKSDLIITGKNGSGKTQLLDSIFHVLTNAKSYKSSYQSLMQSRKIQSAALEKNIKECKINFEKNKIVLQSRIDSSLHAIKTFNDQLEASPPNKASLIRAIDQQEKQLEKYYSSIAPEALQAQIDQYQHQFNNSQAQESRAVEKLLVFKQTNSKGKVVKQLNICYNLDELNSKDDSEDNLELILYFSANRASSFAAVQHIRSLEQEKNQIRAQKRNGKNSNAGSLIEQFLANWEVKSALREKKNDYSVTKELKEWKAQFVDSLRVLLDDDSTDIEFNEDTLNYEINQTGKEPFSFRDLSSGYSAILKVFVELLMQTEVSNFSPQSIEGYVIIDEIDVHLHVSLQRKVLPFLSSLFPKVQFIVSTHSPFVLMSGENTVVFDMEKNEQMDEDLSFYSYSAVLEGVLGIKPTSLQLEDTIAKVAEVMNSETIERSRLEQLISELEPLSDKLNNREKSFYLKALNVLADMDED